MTPEERAEISRERIRLAEFITAHPSRFYICEGCESILDAADLSIIFCPRCAGYRFSYDRGRLLDLVAILAKSPPEKLVGEA